MSLRAIADNDQILQWLNDRKRKLLFDEEMPFEMIYTPRIRHEGWKIANIQFYSEQGDSIASTSPDSTKHSATIFLTSRAQVKWSRGEDSEIECVFI